MTVLIPDKRLFFASTPKTACSSIKHLFFQLENDRLFEPFIAKGQQRNIHNAAYPGMLRDQFPPRIKDFHRVTVVRDPVARLLSAYGNRIVVKRELSRDIAGPHLDRLGLDPDPSLETFIDLLEQYQQANPSTFHHTRPASDFIGTDPGFYHRIYRMDELDTFARDMCDRMGKPRLPIAVMKAHGPKFSPADLTRAQQEKIRRYYAEDYRLYGDFM